MISPFPYKIDAPFGWWTPASGLTVCGGKNWDDDQVTFEKHFSLVPNILIALAATATKQIFLDNS